MSRYTFLRVEVDSDVVERVLGLTPGVEVVETLDGERDGDDTPPTSSVDGPLAGMRPSGDTLDEGSAVREYGLLGVGIAFVTLGIATVGIWWYRRRSGDESSDESGESETPPPATEFESPGEPSTPAPADVGGGPGDDDTDDETDAGADVDAETDELNLVLDRDEEDGGTGAEMDDDDSETDEARTDDGDTDTDAEPAGRSEDREDVEWEPKWSDSPPEPSIDTAEVEDGDDDTEDIDEPRSGESVDAAPLLGIAFIAVTGALVRWAKGESDRDET